VGEPAPELALKDLDGRTWTRADGDGRLVWVNFWATSCEPWRTAMPAMSARPRAYPDELLVMGVDWGAGRNAVEDFVTRYGIEYTILLDPGLETCHRWAGTDGLPRHYFIGRAPCSARSSGRWSPPAWWPSSRTCWEAIRSGHRRSKRHCARLRPMIGHTAAGTPALGASNAEEPDRSGMKRLSGGSGARLPDLSASRGGYPSTTMAPFIWG